MLITRQTDYAIRALRALSCGKKKTLAVICSEEAIPQQFGYKILKRLGNAGYINIKRGKVGGYIITDSFKDLTLFDLTGVMENPMDISPCVRPGYRCEAHTDKDEPCKINLCLSTLQEKFDADLKSVKLSSLFWDKAK